jgi:hypothetical protein
MIVQVCASGGFKRESIRSARFETWPHRQRWRALRWRADRPAKRSVMLGVSRERPTLTELLPRYGIMACWNTKGLARSASKTVWRKFIGRHPPPLSDDERLPPSPAIP